MAAATGRKTVSIYDYPEHLNPFREDDNHNKIRFWTLGRKLNRSNSISFSGIKDIKNSWAFRSFMRKGKKGSESSSKENKSNQLNGDTSPIVYRRAMQYSSSAGTRSTVPAPTSPERADRYVYGGSVTPLPRSRFQERLRSTSQQEVSMLSTPRMTRSEMSGSRLSVESTNPFDECPVPPVRASRRKKKRAPAPPPATGVADVSVSSDTSELQITQTDVNKAAHADNDLDIEEMNLNVELKIVEDEEVKNQSKEVTVSDTPAITDKETIEVTVDTNPEPANKGVQFKEIDEIALETENNLETGKITENIVKSADSEEDILNSPSFPKVDIMKYRRNSSVNDDDIKLRRGNLEDFHSLSNKRSKSLTNTLDSGYVTYDINLNENSPTKDKNGNEEPQKVICKLYTETARKQSIDNSISSTDKEFLEIDKVTREFEREIHKLNAALAEDDFSKTGARVSVSNIKRKFDKSDVSSPNPIPKPRRSHHSEPGSPVNGNIQIQLT